MEWILKIRGEEELGDLSVRDRVSPRLNLEATSLQTLIPWKLKELHEPVYTCKLDREQLTQILEKPFPVPKYSIHTQVRNYIICWPTYLIQVKAKCLFLGYGEVRQASD